MSEIKAGDTVKVLGHRNAYGETIPDSKHTPFKTGETFVVGRIEDEHESGYPCPIAFPVDDYHLWRLDDLELVAAAHVPTKIERIRAYRKKLDIGLAAAKRMVEHEDTLAAIDAAHTVGDLKAILRQMAGQP